jgi:hypothetical protein
MTFREDLEPTLMKEKHIFETHEHNAETLESSIAEHTPESLARAIRLEAELAREAARKSKAKYVEMRRELEKKYGGSK